MIAADPVLVAVSVDPQTSHRAAEAVRIALGLVAAESQVVVLLLGAGAKVLDAAAEDYVDGEELLRHLGTLKKLGLRFHVQAAALGTDPGWNPLGVEVLPVDDGAVARLVAESPRTLVF